MAQTTEEKETNAKSDEKVEEVKEEIKTETTEIKSEEEVSEEEKAKEEGARIEKEEKKILNRVYTIPLGDVYAQPWSKRARKAIRKIREFLQKHTKKEVKIASDVNEAIWCCGMKHPPRKIRVNVEIEENTATARLLK